MGCTASNDAKNVHDLEELREYIRQQELKATEQQNLLRFKIEVLVNMLAVEEKRSELTNKRLDTLKWLVHSQGVTEEAITKILNNLEKDGKISLDSSITFTNQFQNTLQLMDLSGAIDRMREDFRNYRDDLLHCYALSNGRLLSSLPSKDFIEQTYNVTEKVSKADLKVLAMRFDDGYGEVCIPEFLEYFAIPPEVRNAKIAERAVKMSLDLFSLDVELLEEEPEDSMRDLSTSTAADLRKSILKEDHLLFDAIQGPEMRKSHFTRSLDRGAKRLLVMWVYVRDDLEKTFLFYQKAEMVLTTDKSTVSEEKKKESSEEGKQTASSSRFSKKRFASNSGGIAIKEGKADDSSLLADNEEDDNEEEIITVDLFRKSLEEICGEFSMVLEKEVNEGIIRLAATSKLSAKPAILQNNANNSSTNASNSSKPSTNNNSPKSATPTAATGSAGGKENHSPNSPTTSNNQTNNNKAINSNNNKPPTGKPEDSKDQKSASITIPEIHPLDAEDIQFLIDRFEISGFIHYRYFLRFFNDLYDRWMKYSKRFIHLPDDWMDVTPFRLSSEWKALKQTSSLRQSFQQTHDRSAQSIHRSKDRLSQTSSPATIPSNQNKAFTAPKKVPSNQNVPTPTAAETAKKPIAEPKDKTVEEVKPEEKKEENEKLKADEKEATKDASKESKDDKDKEKKPEEEKKTAPVVDPPKGMLCCGATAAKPSPNQPIDLSADKKDNDAKGAEKKSDKVGHDAKCDLKIETDDLAEGKGDDDSLKLKRNESFDTPKNIKRKPVPKFDRYEGNNNPTIEREGLGHGDAVPEIKDRTRKGRFRRRADRDFDQEKPELDDDDEK